MPISYRRMEKLMRASRKTYSESFGVHAILDEGHAVAERLAVEVGVLRLLIFLVLMFREAYCRAAYK